MISTTIRFLFFLFLTLISSALIGQGIIQGRVYDNITQESVPLANIVIQGTSIGAQSDFDGLYKIENVEPGLYNLEVSYLGFKKQIIYEVQVSNNRPAEVDFALEQDTRQLEAVEITADPFNKTEESPVSLRTIGLNEIQRNPGGNRDISRAIQSLPGVASSVSFRNDILIRGGGPNENRFFIDGIEIPVINHFSTQGATGGPVGMINVDLLKEVDFYSGAYPANKGNTLSSVLDFKFKDGRKDRLGGSFTVGASEVGATVEGPIGDKTTFVLSARRSYLQFLFQIFGLPFLPTYNDLNVKVKISPNNQHSINFIALGALDNFTLNLDANETEDQKYLLRTIPVNDQWNYTIGAKYTNFREKSYSNLVISRSHLNNTAEKYQDNDDSTEDNLILNYASEEIENKLRLENVLRISGYKILAGAGYEFITYKNETFKRISTPIGIFDIDYDSKLNINKYNAFTQVSKEYLDNRLTVSAGFRIDGNDYSEDMSNPFDQFSPRLSLSYKIAPKWALNFNTGIYYQLPPLTALGYRENDELVNIDNGLKHIKNKQLVAGIEFNPENNAKLTVEGFYKFYNDYPFSLVNQVALANLGADFGVIGDEKVVSTATGRAYGFEFLAQQKLYKGFYGILAYTFVYSEFEDRNGDYVPSSWDSRHIISLTAGKKFKRNWELGAKWRFQSPLPYTPIDLERSSLRPVWDITGTGLPDFSLLNTKRLASFHQLDLRVDKKYFFKKWNIDFYFDIANAYGYSLEGAPNLGVELDANDLPIVDPNDPSRYKVFELDNPIGTAIPSIGIILEY